MDAIARALSPTSGGSTFLRKGTRSFCRSLTLTCQNSPCWRSCERCITSFLSSRSPWAPLLTQLNRSTRRERSWSSRGMCVNWNVLQYLCAIVELQPVATRLPGVRLPLDKYMENSQQTRLCGARSGSPQIYVCIVRRAVNHFLVVFCVFCVMRYFQPEFTSCMLVR